MTRLTIDERLWSKVDRSQYSPGGCWPWTAHRNRDGYGTFLLDGHKINAHRAVLLIAGVDLEGKEACHRCDNPPCCNPAHLFAGTRSDNQRDCENKRRRLHPSGSDHWSARLKDRMPIGDHHWSRRHPEKRSYGERNGFSKVTAADVLQIRALHGHDGNSLTVLAKRFGIKKAAVSHIVNRRNWKHI